MPLGQHARAAGREPGQRGREGGGGGVPGAGSEHGRTQAREGARRGPRRGRASVRALGGSQGRARGTARRREGGVGRKRAGEEAAPTGKALGGSRPPPEEPRARRPTGGRFSASRAPGEPPAAILDSLPPPRASPAPISPPRKVPGGREQAVPRPAPRSAFSTHRSTAVASQRRSPAPASALAPRLREGAWPTVGPGPASLTRHLIVKAHKGSRSPPCRWGRGFGIGPRPQGSRRFLLATAESRRRRSPFRLVAPSRSRPSGAAHGRLHGCRSAGPFPSAVRGWEAGAEAEPPFQTAAEAPRRGWAPGHGLRREQVGTWPGGSPRGPHSGRSSIPGLRRPRRAEPLRAAPRRRFPQGRESATPPAPAARGVPGLVTPLARPVAFPV